MRSFHLSVLMLLAFFAWILTSCSGANNPVEPKSSGSGALDDSPVLLSEADPNRCALAIYDAFIDPAAGIFTVSSNERTGAYHFPLTQWYPNVLEIIDYGFTPNFWADIKITHPLPGTGHDAFDPRVIAILPATPGNSFNYPLFNAIGNNKVLLNYDDYTKLYDNLGGNIPGNTNPFKAYFKDQIYRRWSSIDPISETQRWEMDLDGFGGPLVFKLVVDVSTSYPQYPEPPMDNAPEPVQIDAEVGGGLTSDGGSAVVTVTLKDWQGYQNIKCKIEAPDLFNGVVELFYSGPGPGFKEHIFSGTISNELLAAEGEYRLLISAWDVLSDIHVFDETTAFVDFEQAFNLVDITPSSLNFGPHNKCIDGSYLYIASFASGLSIFDISNPVNPVWVSGVNAGEGAVDVDVSNGYACFVDGSEVHIVDIEPPDSAHIVKSLDVEDAHSISISDGYAFVASSNSFHVVDIDPPETAFLGRSFTGLTQPSSVEASDGYACLTGWWYDYDGILHSWLDIYDIDPIGSMDVVKSFGGQDVSFDPCISGGYLYIASEVLIIRELIPPDFNVVKSVDTPGRAYRVHVSDGYAYVTDDDSPYDDLQIIDVDPPASAYLVKTVEFTRMIEKVVASDGYAYVSDSCSGFLVVDADPPDSAYIAKSVYTPGQPYDINLAGDFAYAYLLIDFQGMQIVSVEDPSMAHTINGVDFKGLTQEIFASGGYAFVTDDYSGIQIIDVDPPDSASIVNTVDTYHANGIFVSDGYAYVADGRQGLQIIDIEPVDSAHIVKNVETPVSARCVFISDGYAFIGTSGNLIIIDIEPVDLAYIEKTVETQFTYHVSVSGDLAFTTGNLGFQIIDINPINSAHIVKTIELTDDARGFCISGGYAYVTDFYNLHIIDIYPPDAAYIVETVDTPGFAVDVNVSGNYAYIADLHGGMRIFKLW